MIKLNLRQFRIAQANRQKATDTFARLCAAGASVLAAYEYLQLLTSWDFQRLVVPLGAVAALLFAYTGLLFNRARAHVGKLQELALLAAEESFSATLGYIGVLGMISFSYGAFECTKLVPSRSAQRCIPKPPRVARTYSCFQRVHRLLTLSSSGDSIVSGTRLRRYFTFRAANYRMPLN